MVGVKTILLKRSVSKELGKAIRLYVSATLSMGMKGVKEFAAVRLSQTSSTPSSASTFPFPKQNFDSRRQHRQFSGGLVSASKVETLLGLC